MIDIYNKTKIKKRQRSIAISDNMVEEIIQITRGYVSVSSFIRLSIIREIERIKRDGGSMIK